MRVLPFLCAVYGLPLRARSRTNPLTVSPRSTYVLCGTIKAFDCFKDFTFHRCCCSRLKPGSERSVCRSMSDVFKASEPTLFTGIILFNVDKSYYCEL